MFQLKNTIFILLSVTILLSTGQTENLKNLSDSLKLALQSTNNDSLKAEILNHLSETFLYTNPDSVIHYGRRALELSKVAHNLQAQLGAEAFIGSGLIAKGDLPKALELGLKDLELGKNLPARIAGGLGPTYSNLGTIYFQIGDYEKAFFYFNKMIELGDGDLVGTAYGYLEIARIYKVKSNLDSAMISLDNAYQTFRRINYSDYPNVYDFNAAWHILKAQVYYEQHKSNLALNSLFSILNKTIINGQAYHTSSIYFEIAKIYRTGNQPDSAIYYAKKGLTEARKVSYLQGVLDASKLLADLFEAINQAKALHYFKLATKTQQQIYGAGNIQVMKDMIEQNEMKQREIKQAREDYQNRLTLFLLIGGVFSMSLLALILYRNSRQKQQANNLLQQQKAETENQKKYIEEQNKIIQAENDRKSIELEEARQLQLSMLPKELPQLPHLDIAVYMQTATEVGGDYYDFSLREDGSLNIALGDATGHGLKAGIMVSAMKSIFTTNSTKMDMSSFFATANSGVKSMGLKRMMMGLTMLNINNNAFQLINAGMPPVFLFRSKSAEVEEITEHGMPIGAMSLSKYTVTEGRLHQGDVMLLLTDGMPELQNEAREMFGYERIRDCLGKIADKNPTEIIHHLKKEGASWAHDKLPDDDVTFVVIKYI